MQTASLFAWMSLSGFSVNWVCGWWALSQHVLCSVVIALDVHGVNINCLKLPDPQMDEFVWWWLQRDLCYPKENETVLSYPCRKLLCNKCLNACRVQGPLGGIVRDKYFNRSHMKLITLVPRGDLGQERWSKGLWLYDVSVLLFFTLLRYNPHAMKFGALQVSVLSIIHTAVHTTISFQSSLSPKGTSVTLGVTILHSILHSLLRKAHGSHPCFLTLWVCLLWIFHIWNHILHGLLCPASFAEHNDFQVHLCCNIYVLHSFLSE